MSKDIIQIQTLMTFLDGTKSERMFFLEVDEDCILYAEKRTVQAIKNILTSMRTPQRSFEYVSHTVLYYKPIEIPSVAFTVEFDKLGEHEN